MKRVRQVAAFLLLFGLALAIPAQEAFAQAAVRGAIIGGAVGGRRGAAVGAATGAAVQATRRAYWHGHHGHWRGHNFYYWSHGSCWVRTSSGRSHRVASHYCRW